MDMYILWISSIILILPVAKYIPTPVEKLRLMTYEEVALQIMNVRWNESFLMSHNSYSGLFLGVIL